MTRPFRKILIANRGEIAVRILQACRDLGIATVALYTEADSHWLPRRLADEAVCLGTGPAADSYIHMDKVLDAAKRTGADAIHPGYGFLAENADFARRCEQAGIVFIGPAADTIELMGNKARAKAFVASLGIPVIPGADVSGIDDAQLTESAQQIGFPLMLKAVAGGGGMGIRIVENAAGLADALASVRHEARASFGDDRLLLEKYFPAVRHIEVQVLADSAGNAVHCYERECSVQRRRQKVIEEAPSPVVSAALREALCEASLKIVNAANYRGVGTVEFVVVDAPGCEEFYFLEMNTRLQVEHGVTEAVTGLDLVRLQIAVAEGQSLPVSQSDIPLSRHAIECRLCAEDPAQQFQPDTGTVRRWVSPTAGYLRVDTGITEGAAVSVYYDSLLAKLIVTGDTRDEALRRMRWALRQTQMLGLRSNQQFLARILEHPGFVAGAANTTFLEREREQLLAPLPAALRDELAALGALACARQETRHLQAGQGGAFTRHYQLLVEGEVMAVELQYLGRHRYQITTANGVYPLRADIALGRVTLNGIEKPYRVEIHGQQLYLHLPGVGGFTLARAVAAEEGSEDTGHNHYSASMAGQVVAVLVGEGATVDAGDPLVVIESMKMEHRIIARAGGVIETLCVAEGDVVQMGSPLLTLADIADATTHEALEA